MTVKVSNSEMRVFKDCERKWYLQYYRELAPNREKASGPLALGTKVHIALDNLYTAGVDPLETVNHLYQADLDALEDHPFGEDVAKELRKEWELAKAMIEGFIDWRVEEGIDAGMVLQSVEEVVEVPSEVEGVTLRAKLDQRWVREVDGLTLFNDWKTTQTFTDKWRLVMDEQMLFYNLLLQLRDGKPTDGALYTMLRKVKRTATAKPPFYQREEVRHNKAQLRSMYLRTVRTVQQIMGRRAELDAGGDPLYVVPPNPTRDCSWKCPFVNVCPLFDDGSNVEQALAEDFHHLDPHERYNKEEETQG